MSLPTLSGAGRATADPDLRFSPNGVAVVRVSLAFNQRKRDDKGNWVDGDVLFINGTAFNRMAENIAETVTKGTEVVVTGRLRTNQWEDKEGNKRSTVELLIDSIGPALTFASATVTRNPKENGGGQRATGADDPWATASKERPSADTSRAKSGWDDEPPF